LNKNLVLTGMMGVGKSTIANTVSKKLKMRFIDIDKIVEEKENLTISQIFQKKGELYFREIEEKISISQLQQENSVIALGGGAFINNKIRNIVLKSSISVWLDLDIKLIANRLKNARKRPLLEKSNLLDTLNKIYLNRKAIYDLANHKINCDKINQSLIIDKIIVLYENN